MELIALYGVPAGFDDHPGKLDSATARKAMSELLRHIAAPQGGECGISRGLNRRLAILEAASQAPASNSGCSAKAE